VGDPIGRTTTALLQTVLVRVQWRLPCDLEDHLIEHAERNFLAVAVEPVFRDAAAEGLQLLAARVRVFLHQCGLPRG